MESLKKYLSECFYILTVLWLKAVGPENPILAESRPASEAYPQPSGALAGWGVTRLLSSFERFRIPSLARASLEPCRSIAGQ